MAKLSGEQEQTQFSVPVQDGDRIHVEEGQVLHLPPEPPDTPVYSNARNMDPPGVQEGTLVSVPVQDGVRVHIEG